MYGVFLKAFKTLINLISNLDIIHIISNENNLFHLINWIVFVMKNHITTQAFSVLD